MEPNIVKEEEKVEGFTLKGEVHTNGNGVTKDQWTQRLCILGIVGTLQLALVGLVVLSFMGREPHPALAGIAGVALGALANAMMPSRRP